MATLEGSGSEWAKANLDPFEGIRPNGRWKMEGFADRRLVRA